MAIGSGEGIDKLVSIDSARGVQKRRCGGMLHTYVYVHMYGKCLHNDFQCRMGGGDTSILMKKIDRYILLCCVLAPHCRMVSGQVHSQLRCQCYLANSFSVT